MRKENDGTTAVEIGNPATAEFEVCRTSLLPSALKTLGANKDTALPIKLFEVSDVVYLSKDRDVSDVVYLSKDRDVGSKNKKHLVAVSDVVYLSKDRDVGAKNEKRLVAVYCGKESGFEVVHGLLNRVMDMLGVPHKGSDPALETRFGGSYHWEPSSDPTLFPGRQAKVFCKGQEVGSFGIVHPEVLEKFDIPYAVSALELNIEPFCFDQNFKSLLSNYQ
eukprot:gene30413-35418_t